MTLAAKQQPIIAYDSKIQYVYRLTSGHIVSFGLGSSGLGLLTPISLGASTVPDVHKKLHEHNTV